MDEIPRDAFRGRSAHRVAFAHMWTQFGIDRHTASERLHDIKASAGLGAADNVAFARNGDVYDDETEEYLGSLVDPSA